MKKQTNIKRLCGVLLAFVGVVLGGAAIISVGSEPVLAADTASWGPQDRTLFTWDSPASYPVFNSMSDNPDLESETNFVRIRKAGSGDAFGDSVKLEVGEEYEVYAYVHNNASESLNASGAGIAENVRLAMELPEKITGGTVGIVKGTISSTNTTPRAVWDTAYMESDQTVYLRYVNNSAKMNYASTSYCTANGTLLSGTALFSEDGARLVCWPEEDEGWGRIPGCNNFAGYVTFNFVVDQPLFYIENEVSEQGKNNWVDTITAKPGEVLDFKTHYKNWGTTEQTSVTICEDGGNGLLPVNGSVRIAVSYSDEVTTADDTMFDKDLCMVVGDFQPEDEFDVTYKMRLSEDEEIFPCGQTVTHNDVTVATANGSEYDRVKITVNRECEGAETVTAIPSTGPAQIALAAVVVIAIIGGGFYLYDSQRKLDKTARRAGVAGTTRSRSTTAKKSAARKNTTAGKTRTSTANKVRSAARTNSTAQKMTAAQKASRARTATARKMTAAQRASRSRKK